MELLIYCCTVYLIVVRVAKKKLDNRPFFGGILHVCYAPEFETVNDTREKLQERRKVIAKKTRGEYYLHVHITERAELSQAGVKFHPITSKP